MVHSCRHKSARIYVYFFIVVHQEHDDDGCGCGDGADVNLGVDKVVLGEGVLEAHFHANYDSGKI